MKELSDELKLLRKIEDLENDLKNQKRKLETYRNKFNFIYQAYIGSDDYICNKDFIERMLNQIEDN